MEFKNPPILYNEMGEIRKVGFELEFSKLGIEESVQLIQNLFGGSVEKINRFRHKVNGTKIGDFSVEFDLTLLTEKSYKKVFDKFNIQIEGVKMGDSSLEEGIETILESIVGIIFPYEISCPPVPITDLDQVEKLRAELHIHHAEGTKDFLTNAFGTHINVEVPDTHVKTLLQYMRAFLLLYPWLLEKGETDLARRVSPFIDPFPIDYVALLLASEYEPNLERFFEDYYEHNPDRNRPLDMYPLFASLNGTLLDRYTALGKVKPRNTFHYRLPNSSISDPEWSLAREWNNWVIVEELANDPKKLAKMSRKYLSLKKATLIGFDSKWMSRTEEWLS